VVFKKNAKTKQFFQHARNQCDSQQARCAPQISGHVVVKRNYASLYIKYCELPICRSCLHYVAHLSKHASRDVRIVASSRKQNDNLSTG